MLSTALAAWRNLVKRLSVDWLILTAGTVTVLLAMILLAAGPIYADAVTQSALRRTLETATLADSTVVAELRTPPGEYERVDRIATDAINDALADMDAVITRLIDAESLELPIQNDDNTVDLAQVRFMEGIESHSELLSGTWPDPSSTPVSAAVSESTAIELGLEIGDDLVMADRRNRDRRVEVRLVGIFRPEDPADSFWLAEEMISSGMEEARAFRTFGPFIVAEAAISEITPRVTASWRAYPVFDTLQVDEASRVRTGVAGLVQALNELSGVEGPRGRFSEFTVTTGLDELLSGAGRSLTVTRSSVLALLIQLAILAGYALALTAGLLAETRRTETALLRARGAGPGQVVAVAGLEGLLLTVPPALAAPWLAAWTLEVLASLGPLAPLRLDVDPVVTTESQLAVLVAVAAAIMALVWPAWRSARSLLGASRRRKREVARSGAQRAGVDVALLGLAVLAFWQLESLGSRVSSTIQGRFSVDPILIAAPTLGLLAGTVLALRIVPLLARLAERVAAAGRSSVPALSAWQVARRPLRYSRAALLLIMAVAIGFFAASYSSTWLDSQRDQADFQAGADLRVAPNRRTGDSVGDLQLVSAQESIPGVSRSMPVTRLQGALPGSETPAEFLLLDTAAAAEVVTLRSDLGPEFSTLMAEMHSARANLDGVVLEGAPRHVGVVIEAVEEEAEDHAGMTLPPSFTAEMALVLQDDDGLLHRVELGDIAADEGRQTMEAELSARLGDGNSAQPAYPIRIVAIEVESQYAFDVSRTVTFDVIDLVTAETPGDWQPVAFDHRPEAWAEQVVATGQVTVAPAIEETPAQPDGALRLTIETGVGFGGVSEFAIRRPWTAPRTYPIVVMTGWLEASNRQVGEEMILERTDTGRSRAVIAGTVEAFPTNGSDSVVLMDLPTYQAIRYQPGSPIVEVEEHWIALAGDADTVAETLLDPPFEARQVVGRSERFLALSTDPVALGTIGALTIGFFAAAVFAAVGFAVSATVSARERITEFALLRALGLSPRQLGAWMTLEQGVLVVSSLAFGTLVGWLLTSFILPLVTVTQDGTRPIPDVAIVYPWDSVVALEAALVIALAVIVGAMTLLLRRMGLGSLLRLGED